MTALTFRTTDNTKWGGGLGADLTASQIDNNFWTLYSMIEALTTHVNAGVQIAYLNVVGQNMWVHLTDHTVLGPYLLPIAQWNFRQDGWQPNTVYTKMDVIGDGTGGALYLVLWDHTSAATFDPNASQDSHTLYGLMLASPSSIIPTGGTDGQRLVKLSATDYATEWRSDTRNFPLYINQLPQNSEVLLRYVSPDVITFPAGLTGSYCTSGINPTGGNVTYNLQKNGASIGGVTFTTSGTYSFSFSGAVTFNPGDVLTIIAPATANPAHAQFMICLVANITG